MLNLQKCDNGFLSTLVAAIFFKNRVWCLRFTSFWKFYSIIFDEEHHYQYRLFCLYSFFNKNIDDDHLIGPALLTCCVLSTTEKLKHIFSQFLPHTSALFYIKPVSLRTAIWYYIAPQISFSAGLSLPAVWYRCCPSLCNWWSSNRSHGPGNSVNVTGRGERGGKNYLPQKTTSFLLHRMTTWTALSPILSIKPVSSRAPGRSRLFPRTCDHVVVVIVIVIVIVHMLHHCLLWSRSAPTKKDKVTRIGIPASCGRSRRLCSSLRLAWHQRHQHHFKAHCFEMLSKLM